MSPFLNGRSTVLPLGDPELSSAVTVAAEAFADSPLSLAVSRAASRERRARGLALGLRLQLPLAIRYGSALGIERGGALAGVLLGAPPYAHPFPVPPLARRALVAIRQGLAVAQRFADVFEALLARRPPAPHFYLALLAVHPCARGAGLGRALLDAWLAGVDAAGAAAWLETDAPESLRLYRRAGFEVRDTLTMFGTTIWLLGREPRHGGDALARGR